MNYVRKTNKWEIKHFQNYELSKAVEEANRFLLKTKNIKDVKLSIATFSSADHCCLLIKKTVGGKNSKGRGEVNG